MNNWRSWVGDISCDVFGSVQIFGFLTFLSDWHFDTPVFLELLPEKLVIIATLVLFVGYPGLSQPFLIMAAELNVLAIADAIVAEIVIISQRRHVWAGSLRACIQDRGPSWKLGQHFLLLLRCQDVPSIRMQEDCL